MGTCTEAKRPRACTRGRHRRRYKCHHRSDVEGDAQRYRDGYAARMRSALPPPMLVRDDEWSRSKKGNGIRTAYALSMLQPCVPDLVQVWVKFHKDREELLRHSSVEPAFDSRGPYLTAHCDVMVGTLIMDTVEAAATMGLMQRFAFRLDSVNGGTDAACLLCHTSTCKFDLAAHELSPEDRKHRSPREAEAIRESGSKAEMKRQGKSRHRKPTNL